MKFLLLAFFCLLSCTAVSQKGNSYSFYKPRPKTFTPVNDYAGILSKEEKSLLGKKLLQYRDSSTNVIVIITQKTLKDTTTAKYTSWKKPQNIILITGVLV